MISAMITSAMMTSAAMTSATTTSLNDDLPNDDSLSRRRHSLNSSNLSPAIRGSGSGLQSDGEDEEDSQPAKRHEDEERMTYNLQSSSKGDGEDLCPAKRQQGLCNSTPYQWQLPIDDKSS